MARIAIGFLMLSGILLAGCDSTALEDDRDCYPHPHPTFPDTCVRYAYHHVYPAWSPDGLQIAYIRSINEEGQGQIGLYIYDLVATEERLVVRGATDMSSQAWSPDGEWITFGYFRILYKVRPDGSDLTQITYERERFRPAWSPDGEWIAYDDATVAAPDQGSWIMRPDGSDNQWLSHIRGAFPTWHPNGDRILTIGGTLPNFEYRIFINNLDAEIPSDTLNPDPDGNHVLYTVALSPDGMQIAYDMSYFDHDIWKMNADGSGIRRLTTIGGTMPAWSPDGSTIAYVNISWRERVIWLMDADGSNKRRMGPMAPPFCPAYVVDCRDLPLKP